MGTDDKTTISFYDTDTGKETHFFDVESLSAVSPIEINTEPKRHFTGELSFSLDHHKSDLEALQQDILQNPDNFTIFLDTIVPIGMIQTRTHKRKRINKKWLKRYGEKMGYKKIHTKVTECVIENNLDCPDCYEILSDKIVFE